jgi:hypothetical protein
MLVFVLLAGLLGVSCAAPTSREGEAPPPSAPAPAGGQDDANTSAEPAHTEADVLMLGRSVMQGWFDYWGRAGDSPVSHDGYTLRYGEIASPPAIARSAEEQIANTQDGTTVFFKLCFVDFESYSAADTEARLTEDLGYVSQVVDAAHKRGCVVVLGNALPRVRAETTPDLTQLHERYNAGLEAIAADRPDVHVFDLYGTLTAPDGALDADFAASPEDSHLNDRAYDALDARFFALLDEIGG